LRDERRSRSKRAAPHPGPRSIRRPAQNVDALDRLPGEADYARALAGKGDYAAALEQLLRSSGRIGDSTTMSRAEPSSPYSKRFRLTAISCGVIGARWHPRSTDVPQLVAAGEAQAGWREREWARLSDGVTGHIYPGVHRIRPV
jgi:hypothetical protein